MLIDTHAHLNFAAFKDDIDVIIKDIVNQGMKVINVGSQLSTSKRAVDLAKKYPDNLYASVGLHPIHLFEIEVDKIEVPFKSRAEEFKSSDYEELAKNKEVVAIGETGLDYFHKPDNVSKTEFKNKQKWAFIKQLELARKFDKPVILHCRGDMEDNERAYKDMLKILKEFGYFKGVIHCFGSSLEIAKQFLDLGFMISFTGIITFPNAKSLVPVVKHVPIEKIMIETDAPYLAPQTVRGKINLPQYVKYIAKKIAEIKNIHYDIVENMTTQNAIDFFKLK